MKPELVYLDSSAIVKLIAHETETPALLSFLAQRPERVSSVLARVEILRALRRVRSTPPLRKRADQLLARMALIRIDDGILETAAELEPPRLRSLDAIHIATALSIREDLAGIISYDDRFTAAAVKIGLPVVAPA